MRAETRPGLEWVEVRGLSAIRLAAAGAPGRGRLTVWAGHGATDLLTLQRADEHAPGLPAACVAAGRGWRHLPLSGRRLEHPEDPRSLAQLPEVLSWLPRRSVVVNCSAGLHRTGLTLYLLLRLAGYDPEAAVAAIAQTRPLTAAGLVRPTRQQGRLLDVAEGWLPALTGAAVTVASPAGLDLPQGDPGRSVRPGGEQVQARAGRGDFRAPD